ncbi:MAG: 50S ribosomal protein L4 [Arenicellales bacterium WSBS_2016_MAG_OTU3]
MQLDTHNAQGQKASNVEVSDVIFCADYNEALVHQVVVAYQAAARSGTASQKSRGQVRGGGKKPFRQKGTGRARAGTIRSPIWRGGGRTFAASTRDYSQKVNKKMYRGAMRSILSELIRQERLQVLNSLEISAPKTKELSRLLTQLNATDVLLIVETNNENLELSVRNLPHVAMITANEVNPYSLLAHKKVVATEAAMKVIDSSLAQAG